MNEGNQRMIALYKQKCPKAKPSSKSNSPTKLNQKMRGKQWKNKRRSHVPTDTNPHHQTFEYNHQPQGVHNSPPQNQLRNSPLYPNQLFSTPPPLSVTSNSPPRTNLTTSSGTKLAHWQYLPGGRPMEIGPSPERPPLPP